MAGTSGCVALRSGFYAIPSGGRYLFVRHKHDAETSELHADTLFVTNVQHSADTVQLSKALSRCFGSKILALEDLKTLQDATTTLLKHEIAQSTSTDDVTPLFASHLGMDDDGVFPSRTYVVTFAQAVDLPPSRPLKVPATVKASFLEQCVQRHDGARPIRSIIIAHADEWMRQYDARQRRAPHQNVGSSPPSTQTAKKKEKRAKKRRSETIEKGSAASAVSRHLQQQAETNIDGEANADGWTLVSRGGRHGKSTLPEDAKPTVRGYGSRTVKVAKAAVTGENDISNAEAGVKQIAGDGFYRFKKDEARRQGICSFYFDRY